MPGIVNKKPAKNNTNADNLFIIPSNVQISFPVLYKYSVIIGNNELLSIVSIIISNSIPNSQQISFYQIFPSLCILALFRGKELVFL